jgi:chemotaxis family two-component system response regulator Rcp1
MTDVPNGRVFYILLVEDNAADIYLFRQALRRAGLAFELTVISDGGEALAFASGDAKRVPDLLVLDLNLPKIGGCQVLETLRRNPALSSTRVAVMTSSAASQDYEKCTVLGVNRYIIKPLGLEEFLRIGELVKQLLLETQARHVPSAETHHQ